MAPRRRAPRRRAKKTFNISAIEAGTALSLMQSTGAASALEQAMQGNIKGSLQTLESSVQSNKQIITATLAGAFIGKELTKVFTGSTLARLGPIRIKA